MWHLRARVIESLSRGEGVWVVYYMYCYQLVMVVFAK